MADEDAQPIIIKKVNKGGGGHHGGAWKVAYADFVTAMMAFFMLLWLLNVVTDEAKDVISSYFDPSNPRIAMEKSGAGGVLGGLSVAQQGSMASTAQALATPELTGYAGKDEEEGKDPEELTSKEQALAILEEQLREEENAAFDEAMAKLEETIKFEKELQELAENLKIDMTPEGMRIQLVDQENRPLFPKGSTDMFDYTRILLSAVTDIVLSMKQNISIRGHTEAAQETEDIDSYSNWELSAGRANAARRVLQESGLPEFRIENVIGKADREPFIEDDPYDERNRRISIILLRESLEEAIERGAFENLKDEIQPEGSETEPSPADLDAPTDGSGPSGIGDGLDEASDEDQGAATKEPGVQHPADELYERSRGQIVFP